MVEVLHFTGGEICRQLRQAERRVLTRFFDTRSKPSIDLAALAIKPTGLVGASADDHGRATCTKSLMSQDTSDEVTMCNRRLG